MADFVLARKSRNILGSLVHAGLNIALGVISIATVIATKSWVLGVILVLLSKWRVFAVRPRFWWPGIKANLVDYVVGLSIVFLAYFAGTEWLPVHIILGLFYIIWLTFLKPWSSTTGTVVQSLVALFLGTNISVIAASTLDSAVPVLMTFVAGYAAGRHILSQDESIRNFSLPSLLCGLLCAETAWVFHHWNIVYTFGDTGIMISQLSVVLTITAFMIYYVRSSLARYDGHFKASALTIPIICAIIAIAVLIIGFSNPFFNI